MDGWSRQGIVPKKQKERAQKVERRIYDKTLRRDRYEYVYLGRCGSE